MKSDLHSVLEVLNGLGFRVDTILPADEPALALLSGHGVRLQVGPGEPLVAPPEPPLRPSFVVTRDDPSAWRMGRAGMEYRDLVPDRQGGRFIASHIRIPHGGPVADYVHFHAIRFQMIYVYRGWVKVVYEDQGEPFVMNEGDCVLQPPTIRHRVLECSEGFEVIEIGSPAVHATHADHALALPQDALAPERLFDGQRFTWHRAAAPGFVPETLSIGAASGGVGGARVVVTADTKGTHDAELLFGFVLRGGLTLTHDGAAHRLGRADAFAVPAGQPFALADGTPDLAWLEVKVPASTASAR